MSKREPTEADAYIASSSTSMESTASKNKKSDTARAVDYYAAGRTETDVAKERRARVLRKEYEVVVPPAADRKGPITVELWAGFIRLAPQEMKVCKYVVRFERHETFLDSKEKGFLDLVEAWEAAVGPGWSRVRSTSIDLVDLHVTKSPHLIVEG